MRIIKRSLILLLLGAQALWPAFAIDAFVIQDIRVKGLQRISPGTVFNYLPVKVGDQLDDTNAQQAIRTLFKTGFFKNVGLAREGNVLVVTVEERASIASLQFDGNKEFDDEALKRALSQADVGEGRIFDPSVLDKLEQELKSQYFSRGRYGATVKTTVTPLERNRVGIAIEIDEGERARIKQVRIIGAEAFEEKDLVGKFELGTKSVFSFFSRRDRYSKEKLAGDLESLTSFYQDNGYLDFAIESTQVSITPDKQDIYITINIKEGKPFLVKDYRLGGKTILDQQQLLPLVSIKPGQVFSRKAVSRSNQALSDRLAEEGYAFANVNAVPEIDTDARTVSFTFFVDPNRRVYVRRINISGNTTTRDEVIRRELRQLEGAWFSADQIRRSRIRLRRLGFFDDVTIETPAVPGSPDQVDINVVVKERATGTLLFGVGYSDAEGVLVNASVSQRNLFGTGKELHLNVDNSVVTESYNIRYVNPYATRGGISLTYQVFSTRIDAAQANSADYITETLGANISTRIPVSEFNAINVGVGVERIDLFSTPETPPEFVDFIANNPSNDIVKLTASFAHDTRNSFIFPDGGTLSQIALEASSPGSDLEYYRLRYQHILYLKLVGSLVLRARGELGYGNGFGDTAELPFFQNFFAGGSSSVRGYKARTLGPKDTGPSPLPIGGDRLVQGNLELFFGVPGLEDSADKRMSLFLDSGQVFGPGQNVDLGEVRASAGVGFHWFSPLGPLSFSYAFPLNDKAGDETENFQFTLGRSFR
ncbi:MAG: outer membrane protein assembly factor BamA [Gammaproteobacteria bacterium]|nr:outer membrane protein assembly factor BamA [Gammaproteobacteria bacterium]